MSPTTWTNLGVPTTTWSDGGAPTTTWAILGDPSPFARILETPEIEYDTRELSQDDLTTVTTIVDQSPEGNDATGVNSPQYELDAWGATLDQIRLQDAAAPNNDQAFSFDGSVFAGTNLTLFAVLRAVDITSHLAIVGSSSQSTPPRRIELFIQSNGSIVFGFQNDPHDIVSATGLVSTNDRVIITARHSSTGGKILRLNGSQVGANATSTTNLVSYDDARLGRVNTGVVGSPGNFHGLDKHFAWISGYSTATSDADITAMEGFLADTFNITGANLTAAAKPTISGPEIEFDARSLAFADGATVTTWNDTSGESNNATSVNTPTYGLNAWGGGIEDIRFTASPDDDHFTYDGSAFVGSNLTIFIAARIQSLTTAAAFVGGASATDLEQLEIGVNTDGSIRFSFSDDGGADEISSTAGDISADGSCFIIVCRHSSTDGKVIRLNGVQVAAGASSTSNLTAYTTPYIGRIGSGFNTDMRLAWLSGYTSALSDCRIEQMEAFLMNIWCSTLDLDSESWCGEADDATTWSNLGDPSTTWTTLSDP